MNKRTLTFGLLVAMCAVPCAGTADSDAQDLYDQHCVGCHGTEVYTRDDRKVKSLPALGRQVQRCETALGLRWFDEDISEMTALLNERFYHFKP